jgi:hypothetical protein
MALPAKKFLFGIPFALLLLVVGVEAMRVWWFRGYSKGSRTGVVRKVSVRGPPYCKYLSGELALQGSVPNQNVEVWEFSIDDDDDKNPLVVALKQAERDGNRITLNYRQDLHSLFRCTPSEYFITGVEK